MMWLIIVLGLIIFGLIIIFTDNIKELNEKISWLERKDKENKQGYDQILECLFGNGVTQLPAREKVNCYLRNNVSAIGEIQKVIDKNNQNRIDTESKAFGFISGLDSRIIKLADYLGIEWVERTVTTPSKVTSTSGYEKKTKKTNK